MYILLAEILIVSALLLIGYRLLLERRTDFRWCRLYLVVLPLLSVVIPLLEIPLWPAKAALMPVVTIGEGGAVVAAEVVTEQAPIITLSDIVLALYCVGVVLLMVLLLYQLWRIRKLERDASIDYVDGVRVVRTLVPVASFSFFHTIYVNRNTSDEDLAIIIKHECSHIAHHHSYERLAMELQKALLWWNPFVWYAARLLTEVEEFEADRDVLNEGEDRTIYIQTIFKQMFGYSPEIANSLRDSLTKKRLIMMTTKIKSRYARLRQVAILPLMLALVVAFGTTARAAQEQDEDKKSYFLMNLAKDDIKPIFLVDGKVEENVEDVDANMIASITIVKSDVKKMTELLKGTSFSEEEAMQRGVVSVQMVKPGNFVKVGEEALYKGVILNYDEEPVVGARIKVGERGVVTDMNGRFEMRATRGEAGEIGMDGYMIQAIHFSNNSEQVIYISKEKDKSQSIRLMVDNSGILQKSEPTHYSFKPVSDNESDAVVKADQMPTFQGGGLEDFRSWVMTQVRFSKEMLDTGVYGRVVAAFVVNTDGTVGNVNILKSPDKIFSDEVIRVLKNSPKWQAGMQDGKAVKVKYTIPINFIIHDSNQMKISQEKPLEQSPTTVSEVVVMSYGESSGK